MPGLLSRSFVPAKGFFGVLTKHSEREKETDNKNKSIQTFRIFLETDLRNSNLSCIFASRSRSSWERVQKQKQQCSHVFSGISNSNSKRLFEVNASKQKGRTVRRRKTLSTDVQTTRKRPSRKKRNTFSIDILHGFVPPSSEV